MGKVLQQEIIQKILNLKSLRKSHLLKNLVLKKVKAGLAIQI